MIYLHIPGVSYAYFKSIFFYIIGFKKDSPIYCAGKCLIEKRTFRLPDGSEKDFFISLRLLKRTLSAVWKNKINIREISNSSSAILTGNYKYFDLIPEYTQKLFHQKIGIYIPKSNLPFAINFFDKLLSTFLILLYSFPIIIFSILKKRKASLALLITEIIECASLIFLLKKNNIRELFDFVPFEKDSNINALILKKNNIYIYKFPSSGPLAGHNKILIGNCLVISSRYHLDEYDYFKKIIFVEKVESWIPELGLTYINKYLSTSLNPPPLTIGYYSSAAWLRKEKKELNATIPGSKDDTDLIKAIIKFLILRKDIKLIIFMHPKEKKRYNDSISYYINEFRGINCEFADVAINSYASFDNVDVGIGVYSTILFERLFCGFKTIFFPKQVQDFPIPVSSLANICPKEEYSLINKLSESLTQTKEEFFIKNRLEEYPFYGWKG